LCFPIDLPVPFQLVFGSAAVENLFGLCRLHQSPENGVGLPSVEFPHLMMDALTDQIADADTFAQEIK
jgi:hypothetical protein